MGLDFSQVRNPRGVGGVGGWGRSLPPHSSSLSAHPTRVNWIFFICQSLRYRSENECRDVICNVIAKKNIPEVMVHAQEYIKDLYKKLDFVEEGEIFEEASIPNITMRKFFSHSR
ncbi:MAG: hypothetical protein V7L22_26870 [Nostoc sp.]|uniref:hypothetical protein n=1 Tax=Nostoc sp. TaxID=1180 RepID=UPI002FFD145F